MDTTEPSDFPAEYGEQIAYIVLSDELSGLEKRALCGYLQEQHSIKNHCDAVEESKRANEQNIRAAQEQILNPPLSFFLQTPREAFDWLCYRASLALQGKDWKKEINNAAELSVRQMRHESDTALQNFLANNGAFSSESFYYSLGEKNFGPSAMRIWNRIATQRVPENPLLYSRAQMSSAVATHDL